VARPGGAVVGAPVPGAALAGRVDGVTSGAGVGSSRASRGGARVPMLKIMDAAVPEISRTSATASASRCPKSQPIGVLRQRGHPSRRVHLPTGPAASSRGADDYRELVIGCQAGK